MTSRRRYQGRKTPAKDLPALSTKHGAAASAELSDDLQRLTRGEITETEYFRTRIELAAAHLKGKVSAERLEMVMEVAAQQLELDPVLLELKRRLLLKARGSQP